MRNMRKALSFALILALVFTSFSVAFGTHTQTQGATLSDIAGLPGEEHIIAGLELGYIEGFPDGTFRPNEVVNRAQFAALVTRAMGIPDSALLGHTISPFLDTDGFGWAVPYLSFVHSRGIMIGDGHGNAMPGRTITMNEGMTMILRAIGYTEGSQELVGTWPSNYVALATQHDLYRDIVGAEAGMTRQNAAIALFNALTVQTVYVDLMGRTTRRWVRYQEEPAYLANTGLNAAVTAEVLTLGTAAMPHFNVADRVGAFGYTFRDRVTGEIIAFRQTSTFITGGLNDWTTPTRFNATNGISYSANFTAAPGAVLMRNGVEIGSSTGTLRDAIVTIAGTQGYRTDAYAAGMRTDGRQVVMSVDIVGATITRVHAINGWTADVATVVTASALRAIDSDGELLGASFPENYNQDIDYRMFQLIGVDCLRDINADDVVYVYHVDDVITRVAVGTEVVEGVMTDANNLRMIVDGRSLNYARRFLTTETRNSATDYEITMRYAGAGVTVRLDAFGNAFEISVDAAEIGNFGIVLSTTANNDPRGHGVVLFTNDDASAFYSIIGGAGMSHFAPRAVAPGDIPRRSARMTQQTFTTTFGSTWHFATAAGLPGANSPAAVPNTQIPQLIGFGLNAAGNINVLERAAEGNINFRSRSVVRIDDARDIPVDANAAIFWNAGTAANPDWQVSGVDNVRLARFTDSDFAASLALPQQYILNVAGTRIVALTLHSDFILDTADDVFGFVNNWDYRDGYQRLIGFFDDVAGTRDTADQSDPFWHGMVTRVALWQMTTNAAGEITGHTNLAVPGGGPRFVTYPNLITPNPPGLGVQLAASNHVSTLNNTLTPRFGPNLITLYPDAVVYRATMAAGRVQYAASSLAEIPHSAWVWGFNTTAEMSDVTTSATVLVWMHNNQIPSGWVTEAPAAGPPVFTAHPQNVNLLGGAITTTATFTVVATGSPAITNFAWEASLDGVTWVPAAGTFVETATTSTLTLTGLTAASNGLLIRAVATNPEGDTESNNAVITW